MAEIINTDDFLIYKNAFGELERSPVIIEHDKKAGNVLLKDPESGQLLGNVNYHLNSKPLKFEGLESHVNGKNIGTKLILELIKISKESGAEGALTAEASPFHSSVSTVKKPLTNIPFYYKCGFQAANPDRHNKIMDFLANGKDIPLGLSVFTLINLSKEAATALEQKAIAQQRAFEKQQIDKATENLQQKIKSQTNPKEKINTNAIEDLDFHR